ncbi:MAG: tyrosine-type recombinase/integrase [Atopobiaceae bacterium]|nr:tyrosine-type recombinase/integrase [Atopobiaceae bacterium]
MKYTNAFVRGTTPPFRGIFKYKDDRGDWKQVTRHLEARGLQEARRELATVRAELEERAKALEEEKGLELAGLTVAEYMDRYFESLSDSQSVERSTLTTYRAIVDHIKRDLGRVKLAELRADQIQRLENKLLKGGLAPASVRKIHVLLKSALGNAYRMGLVERNPADAVRPPKLPAASPNALTSTQRARIMQFLDDGAETAFNLAVVVAIYTGMREGEICGLRWGDVDLEDGTLWVRRSIARDGTRAYVKEPKTHGSRRDVPIASFLADKLSARYQEMTLLREGVGMPTDEDSMAQLYVLGDIDGSFLPPHEVWRQWRALARSMGLVGTQGRVPTFHDLRHTFATYAIAEGIDVKTVSSILGHSNAAMTLNIYASADPKSKRVAAETIDAVMSRRPEPRPKPPTPPNPADGGRVISFPGVTTRKRSSR